MGFNSKQTMAFLLLHKQIGAILEKLKPTFTFWLISMAQQ